MTAELGQKIGRGHFVGRKISEVISRILIPTDVKPEPAGDDIDHIEKAKALLRAGKGLVVIYTHPSRTDTHRLMRLWRDDEFAEPRCLIPIAFHQFTPLARISAWPGGIEFFPIVTKETIDRGKNKGLKEGEGSVRFLIAALNALSQGSTVLLAPSLTRTPRLSLPETLRPTDMLLNAASRKSVPFGVFITGFEINGVTAYESANGFNLVKRYTLHTGRTLEDSKLLEQLALFKQQKGLKKDPNRPFTGADQWLLDTQLPLLVPPVYLPKKEVI